MTWLHRLTIFAYAFMAASSAFSASLPTGHVWHIGACVLWVGLTGLAWHNGRNDARLRGNAIRTTWGLCMLLMGCTEAHTLPADDAGTCIDPHPDCVTFTLPSDALIPWVYPYGCESPNLERYADGEWYTHQGQPCGEGGTCSESARCEL